MKTGIKMCLLLIAGLLMSCNNDDDTNTENDDVCTYAGLTYLIDPDTTNTLIPNDELFTDFFVLNSGAIKI